MISITPIYAGLIGLLYIAVSAAVIRYRRAHKIGLGDAGDKGLLKRMRGHANLAEYGPFGVVLLALVELIGAPGLAVHLLGLLLVAGRVLHAYGFMASPPKLPLRQLGMVLTLTMISLASLGLILHGLV